MSPVLSPHAMEIVFNLEMKKTARPGFKRIEWRMEMEGNEKME